jgi:curved DNA-binding protein CbpA
MINGTTYYQVLGVLATAEDIVINAAYRSLALKYHPDKWRGDDEVAHNKMIEITSAYATLKDKSKRKEYDEELRRRHQSNAASELGDENADFSDLYSEQNSAWELANKFYPDLAGIYEHLKHTSAVLAYTYKGTLIETKGFEKRVEIARKLEGAFLISYFGNDENVICLAKVLIAGSQRDAAKYLNDIVSVMGKSVSVEEIYLKVKEKYPDVAKIWSFPEIKFYKLTTKLQSAARNDIFLSDLDKKSNTLAKEHAPWWFDRI